MNAPRAAVLAIALLFDPRPALAHAPIEGLNGFYGGLLHPALVPLHLLGLVALALMIGQQEPVRRHALRAVFAAALIAGLAANVYVFTAEAAPRILLGATALSGVLAAVARPVPAPIAALLAVMSGAALAMDSRPEDVTLQTALLMLLGTAIGALIILELVTDLTADPRAHWLRIGIRILASWSAASALLVLALDIARSRPPY